MKLVFGVWCLVFGVWCLVFGIGTATAADNKDKFKLITERNIFDSTRTVKRNVVKHKSPPKPKEKPKEYLQLAGVVILNGQAQAIVRGSKVSGMYKVGQELDGLKIEQLNTSQAVVTATDKKLTWLVGKSLQRTGTNAWEPGSGASASFTAATSGSSSRHGAAPTVAAAKPAGEPRKTDSKPKTASSREEILKRLMERRRKELKR